MTEVKEVEEEMNELEKQIIKFLQKRGGFTPLISIKKNFFYDCSNQFPVVIKNMKKKKMIEVRPYGEFGVLNAFLTEKFK